MNFIVTIFAIGLLVLIAKMIKTNQGDIVKGKYGSNILTGLNTKSKIGLYWNILI